MEEYKLINIMEDEVLDYVTKLLERDGLCACSKCVFDVSALALNNLRPHYVTTYEGGLYKKIEQAATSEKIKILMEVQKALNKVRTNMKH